MSELHEFSALEQAGLIRRKEVSPLELVAHYLDRIDRFDRRLGAFITVTPELALEAAARATERVGAGDLEALPPLFGVPTAIKDLTATAGVRTTYGSGALADLVPAADTHSVAAIKAARLISLGKANTAEFGLTCFTSNGLAPDARTPWDETRSAAGSSGGSAAAVAAGLVPLAHGSDAGGSIRTPGAACGLVAFKSSRGAMSVMPGQSWMGNLSEGPLARTVADAAAFLEVITTPNPVDPINRPLPRGSYLAALEQPPSRMRIGRTVRPGGGFDVDPEVVATWEQTSALLADLGHEIVDVEPPDGSCFEQLIDDYKIGIWASVRVAVGTVIPHDRLHLLQPFTRWCFERSARLTVIDVRASQDRMLGYAHEILAALQPFDALLTPTTTGLPTPLDYLKAEGDCEETTRRMAEWSAFTPAYNITGQPAISLPLGHSSAGLPIGMQLVGRPWQDDELIALAAQLEGAAPWRDRHPSIWTE